ncbi:uncharacterized protein [Palaemon carinicauda]|uniref:uncharacterized protein n=1 Tax=Palaemon carinicauda TaxID=392227 RepID=UPI0035B5FF08
MWVTEDMASGVQNECADDADDRVLVTDTEEKLGRLVTDFRTVREKEVGSLCGKSKVMVCTRGEGGDKLSFMWNGGLFEEVDQLKHLGSVVAVIGGVKADARQRMNEGYSVFWEVKGMMKTGGLGMNVKRGLYEKVVVPTMLYGSEF